MGNTKPCFDSEVTWIGNKHDASYKKFKSLGLETDKDILKAAKQFLKTTIQKKKRMFFQVTGKFEKYYRIMENPEIFRAKFWKSKSIKNLFERGCYSIWTKNKFFKKFSSLNSLATSQKNYHSLLSNLTQKKPRCFTKN